MACSVKLPVIPLSLEDCCLAWLVSDLEHYPPELLALLPLRLRHRLLANVPVLDLCRLEYTSAAEVVDLESIWELKCSSCCEEGATIMEKAAYLNYIDLSSLSWRERYLPTVANIVLNNSLEAYDLFLCHRTYNGPIYFYHSNYYTVVVDWLISLRGYQFLNEGGDLQSSYDWQNLASSFLFFEAEGGNRYDRLTPLRYAHYKSGRSKRLSDEKLIALILRNCRFKPKCVLVSPLVDTVSALLLRSKPCDILKEFLNEVEEVQFYVWDKFPNLPVVLFQSMSNGTSPCKLRTLQVVYCDMYPRRRWFSKRRLEKFQKSMIRIITDVIKQQCSVRNFYLDFSYPRGGVFASGEFTAFVAALTSLVARPQFRTLDVRNFPAPASAVMDILFAFLVSPCSHQQTLMLPRLTMQPSLPIATPCPAGAMEVPDSGVEYKTLYLQQQVPYEKSYSQICKTLFAFPKIRLRFLEVDCLQTIDNHYVNTIHMAAQHPDIQVKKLSIRLACAIEKVLPTLRDDMRALLQIPTLTSLSLPLMSIITNPGNSFLLILAQELPKCHHLAALEELNLGMSNFLELPAEEVEHLFQSIFSLPRLNQLTLKMASCVVSFHHYKLIHRLWTEYSSGERLKKLVIGSAVLVTEKKCTDEFSVAGIMPLLDSMAQTTSVVSGFGQLSGVKTDLIKAELETSD